MGGTGNVLSGNHIGFRHDGVLLPGHTSILPYDSIKSARVYLDRTPGWITYLLVYWLIWLSLTYGFMFSTGSFEWKYILQVVSEIKVAGVIVGLGLLAMRPVRSMLPTKPFVKITTASTTHTHKLDAAAKSEELDQVVKLLKRKLDESRLTINLD